MVTERRLTPLEQIIKALAVAPAVAAVAELITDAQQARAVVLAVAAGAFFPVLEARAAQVDIVLMVVAAVLPEAEGEQELPVAWLLARVAVAVGAQQVERGMCAMKAQAVLTRAARVATLHILRPAQ